MRYPIIVIVILMIAGVAHGRGSDGSLENLILPNSGRPAIAIPGESIQVQLRAPDLALTLEANGKVIPLQKELVNDDPQTTLRAILPEDLSPGVYDLRAGKDDLNAGAVHVLPAWPDEYKIAFLSIDNEETGEVVSAIQEAKASGASLLFIVGLDKGTSEIVPSLDTASLPVLISPKENNSAAFKRCFGPEVHGFRFGPDGYLCFGGVSESVDEVGSTSASLQYLQRKLRASRWRVGIAPHAGGNMPLRIQTVLFVDNPLDYCLVAESSFIKENSLVSRSPWGDTVIAEAPPDGTEARLNIINVSAVGLNQRTTDTGE